MRKKILYLGMVLAICMIGMLGCAEDGVSEYENIAVETNTGEILELYQILQKNEAYPYQISETAKNFLEEHENLFPAQDISERETYIDRSIEYKHLNKNIEKYGDKLFLNESMYVLDIHEENTGEGFFLTTMQVLDDVGNSFIVFYKGELPNVFKEDTVLVCGLPLGLSSFNNVAGGSTIAVVLAGCTVESEMSSSTGTVVENGTSGNTISNTANNTSNSIDYVHYYQPIIEEVARASEWSEYVDYMIYDIDNDGIYELLVDSGEQLFYYTINNNSVVELGSEYVSYPTFFTAEDGEGVYMVIARMGCESVFRMRKQGNEMNLDFEWSIESGCLKESYYENSHPIIRYDIGNYTALENPPVMNMAPVTVKESKSYLFRKSSSTYLQKSELQGLNAFECKIARNEIYARYGRLFTDAELQAYFNSKDWYLGNVSAEAFDESLLNDYERANLDLIIQYEIEQGYR